MPCQSAAASSNFTAIGADDQIVTMHRGMNVLNDDHIWENPADTRFRLDHFARIRDAGFDTVRLNLHAFRHTGEGEALDADWLATLDRLVKAAIDDGLTVILDEHDDLACDDDAQECAQRLPIIWRQIAERYRGASNRLLFEPLNEPHGSVTAEQWNTMLRTLLAAIRPTNPARNVVIGPAGWNSVEQLPTLNLPDDPHIIVTVHYYAPLPFTHQGARWSKDTKNLSGITWGTDAELAKLVKDFNQVKDWSDLHHRPILLGEFGAYDKGPMESRARYLSAVARVAEAHGFAWAYWQFDSDFIAYDMDRDAWVEPILHALVP